MPADYTDQEALYPTGQKPCTQVNNTCAVVHQPCIGIIFLPDKPIFLQPAEPNLTVWEVIGAFYLKPGFVNHQRSAAYVV